MGKNIGTLGEDAAATFLIKKGYEIVARNYHSRYGEIDIIAAIGQYIVFAEVKTRRQNSMCRPAETVTVSKQQKIIKTALSYLMEHPEYDDYQIRFDVAALTTDDGGRVISVEYLPNSFEGELL